MTARQIKEFFVALKLISSEKGVDLGVLIEKLKSAMVLAVKKQYFGVDKINVIIDVENNVFKVSFFKMVVDNVKNFANEILLDDALKISKKAEIGKMLEIEVESSQIGRLAAGAAKQQIVQGIRDMEKENIVDRMGDRVGTLITAPVDLVDSSCDNVVLKIDGSEVILFKNSQLPGDDFKVGDMVKVFAVNLDSSGSGCLLKVSRVHSDFVKKLFEVEVPEIEDGKIEIKRVAREAGVRTKIAVSTSDPNLDPVGCCIGNKGTRIGAIVNELNGEKIDIVRYSDDLRKFVEFALLPAKVLAVEVLNLASENIAFVAVEPSQISLAIGSRGLNVKLAALLTGCKIDIVSSDEQNCEELIQEKIAEKKAEFEKLTSDGCEVSDSDVVVKTAEELMEEEDIHNFEVDRMLEDALKI